MALFESNVYGNDYRLKIGHYSDRVSIGGDDKIESVTQLALNRIKIRASEEAGGYVLRDEKLTDGRYNEQVQVISGALVSISNVKTAIENSDGKMTLIVEADTSVDLDSLERRVNAIKENKEMRKLLEAKNSEYLKAIESRDYSKIYSIERDYLSSLPEVNVSDLNYIAKLTNSLEERLRLSIIDLNDQIPKNILLTSTNNEIYINRKSAYISAEVSERLEVTAFDAYLKEFGSVIFTPESKLCLEFNEGMKYIDLNKVLTNIKTFKKYRNIYLHIDFELKYKDGSKMIVRGTAPNPIVIEFDSPTESCGTSVKTMASNASYVLFALSRPINKAKYFLPIEREYLNDLVSISSIGLVGSIYDEPLRGTRFKRKIINGKNLQEENKIPLLYSIEAEKWTGEN